jgi:multiple sugar transport system substrate-binding protein
LRRRRSHRAGADPASAQVAAGKAATAFDGARMISTYAAMKDIRNAAAPTPVGPTGKRATTMNGLADSITKSAHDEPGAEKWVRCLASDVCRRIVGRYGIVFSATPDGTKAAVAACGKEGTYVSAFTKPVTDKRDVTTFSFPITDCTRTPAR